MTNPISGVSAAQQSIQTTGASSGSPDDPDFLHTLDGMLNEVDGMQTDAQQRATDLLQGNGQDVHSAMIAVEKADLSFQLMMQVRNKIIQAYQTISQIPF